MMGEDYFCLKQAIESAPAYVEQTDNSPRKIDVERLASNLNYLVEHTNDFPIEKLSIIWFELFDLIESCRSLTSEESIFQVIQSISSSFNV